MAVKCYAALMLLVVSSAAMSKGPRQAETMGVGNASCATMTNLYDRSKPGTGQDGPDGLLVSESNMYRQWLWGAMSGASIASGKHFQTDPEGIEGWVLQYCRAHPASSIVNATQAALTAL